MGNGITKEDIDRFLSGTDPMEHIIKIEGSYDDDKMTIIFRGKNNKLKVLTDNFYPFVWSKQSAARKLFNGDRKLLKERMAMYGIGCKGLRVADDEGNIHPRMENGYRVMFYAKFAMSYKKFMDFFKEAGRPIYPTQNDANYGLREFIAVAPTEQYMIYTGRRMFKGYDDYDDLIRMSWDLETEGLDPHIHAISQIGIRTNKGFEKIITIDGEGEEKFKNEITGLKEFFEIIYREQPDIIAGYNTENFDWYFIDERLKLHGSSLLDFTKKLFYDRGIYKKKKQQVLKLGGEMEYYYPTIMWGHNIVDALFAVRRAQAIDSNMKKATLKYICAYSKMNKPNRVYVPGKEINTTWLDLTPTYAFNNTDGEWFKIDDKRLEKTYINDNGAEYPLYTLNNKTLVNNKTGKEYEITTGRYIIQRYLLDDLWETDKVENRYNQPNFLVGKMLPVSYEKMCTMGTAAIWKYIMMAWSYQHDLAIPELIETKKFTGGLSRLLKVGYVDRIVKLDYNSLYPSIILTFGIKSPIDIMGVMNALLEYILTQREHYKGLKAQYGKEADELKEKLKNITDEVEIKKMKEAIARLSSQKAMADKMQLPLKITGNGFFGSYGSGSVFPWSDLECAEETTCRGRQMLRLMISHFSTLGSFNTDTPNDDYNYHPIVGDSFTGDTPVFIKYDNTNLIDIKPISELIDIDNIDKDVLGREYDTTEKNYSVLCRSGWYKPSYIYRHKTNKKIYRIADTHDNKNCISDITEDHSLFNDDRQKIKPSDINEKTKLEYKLPLFCKRNNKISEEKFKKLLDFTIKFPIKIPIEILNSDVNTRKKFAFELSKKLGRPITIENYSKTFVAGFNFL